jgi:hypothetical protein
MWKRTLAPFSRHGQTEQHYRREIALPREKRVWTMMVAILRRTDLVGSSPTTEVHA